MLAPYRSRASDERTMSLSKGGLVFPSRLLLPAVSQVPAPMSVASQAQPHRASLDPTDQPATQRVGAPPAPRESCLPPRRDRGNDRINGSGLSRRRRPWRAPAGTPRANLVDGSVIGGFWSRTAVRGGRADEKGEHVPK